MKKISLILSSIIILILIVLFCIPFFFKDNIVGIIESQASKNMNAALKIGSMNLSMFKDFPNLNVSLKDVNVIPRNLNRQDTLLHLGLLEASVNLSSLMNDEKVVVNHILLDQGKILANVDNSGKANWNIFMPGTPTPDKDKQGEKNQTDKGVELNNVTVSNLFVSYNDYQSSTYASIDNINLELSGDFSAKNTLAELGLALKNISLRQQNKVWINNTDLVWQAEIASDLEHQCFEITKNDMQLNNLKLNITGKVTAKDERYGIHLHLNAPDTKFESLLSLLPQQIMEQLKDVETDGNFKLDITADGDYYENHLPKIDAVLTVNDAYIKYPQLPEAIRKINWDLQITNPGDITDSTHFALKKASFEIAGNPFKLYLNVQNPNNPILDGGAVGTLNFAQLKKALPLKDITIDGILNTNLTFNGKYKYIENEEYEKFTAKGEISLKDIKLVNQQFPEGIYIPKANLTVSPSNLKLNELTGKIYSSDFSAKGKITNYLPYIFKGELLQGNFSINSNLLNINEFLIAQYRQARQDTTQQVINNHPGKNGPSAAEGALEVPRNLNVELSTNINTVIFDQLKIHNVKGQVNIAKAVASLNNLHIDMLNGGMTINGKYSTANQQRSTVDLNLKISDFDIHEAYHAFTFIRKSIPVAMNCEGKVSAAMTFAAILDKTMSPIMNTANGQGYLESQGILLNDNPAMNQLASVLKNDELSRLSISHLKINFKMNDGNIVVEPFNTSFAGNPITIYGRQSVEGRLDYTLAMKLNRRFFGKDINDLLSAIPGGKNIQNIDLEAKVGGTLDKPVIRPNINKAIKSVTKEAGKALQGNFLQGLQGLFK